MSKDTKKSQLVPVVVLVLAWLIPGAGHVYLNRVCRGVIIFVTITATFWAGVAMGGVMTVDSDNERWWFVAQMFSGVNGVIGWQMQRRVYERHNARLAEDQRYTVQARVQTSEEAVSALRQKFMDKMLQEENLALVRPMDTAARAYSGVAGLLNLMCIFDAVVLAMMGVSGEPKPRAAKAPEAPKQ